MVKNKFLLVALAAFSLSTRTVAQDDAAGYAEDKFLERLEKQRERVQEHIERAERRILTLDSIKAASDALKAEGNSEFDAVVKEKIALESRTKSDLKDTEKAMKSSDKTEAASIAERQKEINKQYRTEMEDLKKRVKDANTKIAKATSMVSSSYEEKRLNADWELKEAKAHLKNVDEEIAARRSGKKKK
jgi:predicted RND superfamily exporter protein